MATSVVNLLEKAEIGIDKLRTVKWGETVDSSSSGIYIVSTGEDPNTNSILFDSAPIDDNNLEEWIGKVDTFTLDGIKPTVEKLRERLNAFWLPDENILYIGQTESKKGLKGRLRQFYKTNLGDSKPHAGGHWIKTLKNLNQLYIHFIDIEKAKSTETILLRAFMSQVSEGTKSKLHDNNLLLPFANRELEQGNRKKHGISGSTIEK